MKYFVKSNGYYYSISTDGEYWSGFCYFYDGMINKWLFRTLPLKPAWPVSDESVLIALNNARRKQKLEKLLQ